MTKVRNNSIIAICFSRHDKISSEIRRHRAEGRILGNDSQSIPYSVLLPIASVF